MSLFSVPTVSYCEKAVALIIKRPAYAFSNLAYLASGLLILKERTKLSNYYGSIVLGVGLFSFLYDAQPFLLTQLFDLFMMFVFVSFLLFLNLKALDSRIKMAIFSTLPLISVVVTYFEGGSAGRIIFGAIALLVVATEIYLMSAGKRKNKALWTKAFAILLAGFALWSLDATQVFCFEGLLSLLNGRAIFHYSTALTTYYLYRYYSLQGYRL